MTQIIFVKEWRDKSVNPRQFHKPPNHKKLCEIREQIARKRKILAETRGGSYALAIEIQALTRDLEAGIRANRQFKVV